MRHYDPQTGRFLQPDPFKGYLSEPASQNPYMYCRGNPVKYSDPSGYWDEGGPFPGSNPPPLTKEQLEEQRRLFRETINTIYDLMAPLDARGSSIPLEESQIGPYSLIKAIKSAEDEAHHLIEQRHLKRWGISTHSAPAVDLPKTEHRKKYTNPLRDDLPYGKHYSKQEVLESCERVYKNNPELLEAIRTFFTKIVKKI